VPAFYLDMAAVLKRYHTEPGSAIVDELFDRRTPGGTLVSSRFTLLEGTSVARRLLKGRVLRRRTYTALMARFISEMGTAVMLAPVTDALISEATAVAEQYALRTGDALQLAAAIALQRTSPGERWVFVTNDRQLAEAATAAGFDVLDPERTTAAASLRRLRAHR
jgi:predicted nucleic acid-binding protein